MHAQSRDLSAGLRLPDAEAVALAYMRTADGDRWAAVVQLAADAVAHLDGTAATIQEQDLWISHSDARRGGRVVTRGVAR